MPGDHDARDDRDDGSDAERPDLDALHGADARRRRLVELLDTVAGRYPLPSRGLGEARGPRRAARLGRVCAVSVAEAGVSGAGVTVMGSVEAGRAGYRDQLWATDSLVRRLEDLQLTAGEGPCLDAYESGAPVLAGDLAADRTRWLGFAPEALAAGAAAVFSLPLQVGAVRLGTLDLHRTSAGALEGTHLDVALVLASLATETLLELVAEPEPDIDPGGDAHDGAGMAGSPPEPLGWLPDVHAEVHQASGMVSVREGIHVGEALLRIRGHAFAHGEAISEVARRIIDRDLTLPHTEGGHDDGATGSTTETKR